MLKYDVIRWAQVDGERYALAWIGQHMEGSKLPAKEDLEWKMTSTVEKERTENMAYDRARERRLAPRERAWYLPAFMNEAKKTFEKAYNESEWRS